MEYHEAIKENNLIISQFLWNILEWVGIDYR